MGKKKVKLEGLIKKANLQQLPFLALTKLIAIDIGDMCAKIVEIDFTKEKPLIRQFDVVTFPAALKDIKDSNAQQDMLLNVLNESLKKNKMEAKEVALVLSGGSVFSRKIRLPKLGAKELENGIRWEASNQIPFSLDSSYFDWHFLREITMPDGTKNDEYMIAASNQKSVDEMISLVQQLGLRPICIGIPIFGIYNIVDASSQFDTEQKIAVIDMGPKRTNIAIIENKIIVFAREIPIGEESFNEAIANEFINENWSLSVVEEQKKSA